MERKYETLQRINRELAFEVKTKNEELITFKKTVIQTFENDSFKEKFETEVPSFLKIVHAE